MRRSLILACVAVLALPALAKAQLFRGLTLPRINLAPYIGYTLPYTAEYEERLEVEGVSFVTDVKTSVQGAIATGGTVHVQVSGPIGIVAAATRSEHTSSRTTLPSEPGSPSDRGGASTLLFAKAGIALQLPDEPASMVQNAATAFITIAPAWIHETFAQDPDVDPEVTEPVNHWAVSLGAEAYTPLGRERRFGVFFAIEDNIVFWNGDELARRVDRVLSQQLDVAASTTLDFEVTHLVVLRAGLALTF